MYHIGWFEAGVLQIQLTFVIFNNDAIKELNSALQANFGLQYNTSSKEIWKNIHTDIVKQDLISSQCNFDEDRRMSGQIALSTLDLIREHIMSLHASHGPFDD